MSKYYLFLDETGHHGLKTIDQEFPILMLCGVIVEQSYYLNTLSPQINDLKLEFFDRQDIVFHSRDIRKWQRDFISLGAPLKRHNFYKALDNIIANAEIHVIAAAIMKNQLIDQYGPQASNPYDLSLTFIMERTVFLLNRLRADQVDVIAEARGKKEDALLHKQYQVILTNGTRFIQKTVFERKYLSLDFHQKSANTIGTQLSDLVAYPIATKLLFPDRENLAFRVIEPKLYRQFEGGDYLGYGLKIFP